MPSLSRFCLFAAALCISASAFAQTGTVLAPQVVRPGTLLPDNTINRHFGFFIRPDLGFGYMTSSESTSFGDVTVSGVAALAGVSIGGAVAENVILSAHIYDAVTTNPTVTLNRTSGSTSNTEVTMFGIGPELTYYFMPNNVYLSGTLALSRMTTSGNSNGSASTDWGFGTRVTLGKEWWVSDHWGLGLSGHVSYATNNDVGNTVSTWALGAAFSATYN